MATSPDELPILTGSAHSTFYLLIAISPERIFAHLAQVHLNDELEFGCLNIWLKVSGFEVCLVRLNFVMLCFVLTIECGHKSEIPEATATTT